MNYPDVFHIGIPKTGTTSIQHVLRQDDRINLIHNRFFNGSEWWFKDYPYCKPGKVNIISEENTLLKIYGTVKTTQLLARISKNVPDAKIIITIREQRKMLASRYKYHIPNFQGYHKDFDSWLLTDQGLDYISMADYASMYKVLNAFFEKENIHIMLFEDFIAQPEEFYKEYYQICGLEINPNLNFKAHKNKSLTDSQVKYIKERNKSKKFRKIGKLSEKEAAKFVRKSEKFSENKEKLAEFQWMKGDLFGKLEDEFRFSNNFLVTTGLYSKQKLLSHDYLV